MVIACDAAEFLILRRLAGAAQLNIRQVSDGFLRAPYTRHTIWHQYCLPHSVMGHTENLEKTTIRLTGADRKILERLAELTGLKQSQLIRASLRVLLRSVERPLEK